MAWWFGGEVTGYSWASFSHRKHPRKIHATGEVTLPACPVGFYKYLETNYLWNRA